MVGRSLWSVPTTTKDSKPSNVENLSRNLTEWGIGQLADLLSKITNSNSVHLKQKKEGSSAGTNLKVVTTEGNQTKTWFLQ